MPPTCGRLHVGPERLELPHVLVRGAGAAEALEGVGAVAKRRPVGLHAGARAPDPEGRESAMGYLARIKGGASEG